MTGLRTLRPGKAGSLLCVLLGFLLLCLGGCAGREEASPRVPSVALATEGPPLAIVGEYGGMRLEGYMDRDCMAGYGNISLRSVGSTRKGELSVDIPDLPAPPPLPEEAENKPVKGRSQARPAPEPVKPLALGAYPRQVQTEQITPAVLGVPENPRAFVPSQPQAEGALVLGSYPDQEPPQPPSRTGALRSQSSSGKEQESSVQLGVVPEFVCKASVDHPPTEKGRIRGLLHCTGDRRILFSLRNLGPDQGVGIGKETEDGSLLIMFYHSSLDEAWRRFPAVREDIRLAQKRQQ